MRSRVLPFVAATTIAVMGLGVPIAAWAKPSIAVLGLEVKSDGASIDEQTTKIAAALTSALRKRARMPVSPYKLAPNSNKDLLELKLLSSCPDEGKDCMSQIGVELGADRLLYGRIKRRKSGYQVSLDLLNVEFRAMERSTSEIIPFSEADPEGLERWARSLYNRLAGIPEHGTLVIHTNVDRGTVYIDGEVRTTLSAGPVSIAALAEGSHTVGIESPGYESYGGEVTIAAGETRELSATLESVSKDEGGGGGGRPGGVSRALFWTSLVATGVSGAAIVVTGVQVRYSIKDEKEEAIKTFQDTRGIQLSIEDACEDAQQYSSSDALAKDLVDICNRGKNTELFNHIFVGTTAAAALATLFFYYKGYIAPKASANRERRAERGKRKQRRVQVTPTLGPNQLGAGITIEF